MDIMINGEIIPSDYQEVYDWYGIEATSPRLISEQIKNAKGDRLDIFINSPGGEVAAGSHIFEMLRAYPGEVLIHVQSIAASAASVIMCARESEIAPTAMVMVHNVSTSASGDYHQMEKASEVLKTANRAIASAYMHKAGMTEAEALEMMDKDTWLTAKEAVKIGLVDRIAEADQRLPLAASLSGIGITLSKEAIQRGEAEIKAERKKKMEAELEFLKLKGE